MKTILTLSLLVFGVLTAKTQTWENIGPDGGFFKDFVIHPTNSDIVYAGSDDGGGVWKTTNGGETWNLLTGDYPNFTGWHIEMDQAHPDTLYFCELYGRYGILKTTDGGATLNQYSDGFIHDRDFQTTQLVIYPGSGDTLFASTGEGDDFGRVGNGVFSSYNGGESWNYSGLQGFSVHCIEVSYTNRLFAGTEEEGLYYSDDIGETWTLHPDIPDTASVLQMDIKNGVIAISGAANGVYVSFDHGITFANIGIMGEFNFDLSIISTSPYLEIVSSGFFHPNYFTSETLLWTAMDDPLLEDQLLIGVAGDEEVIYAGIFSSTAILKSTDRGESWSQLETNPVATEIRAISIDPNSDRIYASLQNSYNLSGDRYNKESLALSEDGGESWTKTGPLAHGMDLAMHPTDTETLFFGTFAQGVFKTTDGFETWDNIRSGNKLILDIEFNPDNPEEMMLAEVDIPLVEAGVFRSIDGGDSWYLTGELTATHITYNTMNDEVYFSTENGIYSSEDDGETISATPVFLEGEVVLSMYYNAPFLFAGTEEGGLYKIHEEGMIEDISGDWNSPEPTEVRNILANESTLIVGLNGAEQDTLHNLNGGLWISLDQGGSWMEWTSDLTNSNIFGNTGMAIGNDGELYVGTYGLGVFKSLGLPLSVNDYVLGNSEISIYPNPSQGDLQIQTKDGSQINSISIVTIDGRSVYQNSTIQANSFIISRSELAEGILLVTVVANEKERIQKVVMY